MDRDILMMLIIGGIFLVLGLFGIVWGRKEESVYYSAISERVDVREYVDRSPLRPEPISLKIGGRICLAIGATLLVVGLLMNYL